MIPSVSKRCVEDFIQDYCNREERPALAVWEQNAGGLVGIDKGYWKRIGGC
jgi:hypothetical protein